MQGLQEGHAGPSTGAAAGAPSATHAGPSTLGAKSASDERYV